jgi:hypothetical protein
MEEQKLNLQIWTLIVQLNGYTTVESNVPSKMMGKIENIASRLADDIANGNADFTKMNFDNIGKEVLSHCDETDMNAFAKNIENLLPALQHFQKNMAP